MKKPNMESVESSIRHEYPSRSGRRIADPRPSDRSSEVLSKLLVEEVARESLTKKHEGKN